MAEIEIGMGKSGRRAYGLDEIAIVPSRRTRDPEVVDISWEIDAFKFEIPLMAAPMDGLMSPATAVELDRLGGLGVLNLEGLWTRYADPEPLFEEIAELDEEKATRRLKEIYAEPVQPDLVTERLSQIKDAGAITCGAATPQQVPSLLPAIRAAEPDLLVIAGTIVSAEHVSKSSEPLNLKSFVRGLDIPVIVGGCASYQAALHLMRTGAAGVLVGVGSDPARATRGVLGVGVPQATAIADARAARMRHLDETGVYVHVIADGGMTTTGDIAKAIVCGADSVMLSAPLAAAAQAPGRGSYWGMAAFHSTLPRGGLVREGFRGTLEEVLFGPARHNDGLTNLFGGLRKSMATSGYESLKEFQKAEVVVAPRSGAADGAVRSDGSTAVEA